MESFTSFLVNHYIWFLVVALVLVFALIGYLVDTKENEKNPGSVKTKPEKKRKKDKKSVQVIEEKPTEEINTVEPIPVIEEPLVVVPAEEPVKPAEPIEEIKEETPAIELPTEAETPAEPVLETTSQSPEPEVDFDSAFAIDEEAASTFEIVDK